jgi:branched-chain amino acid transport system substrate-binding protein
MKVRSILAALLGAGAVLSAGAALGQGAGEPVKIGIIYPKAGTGASIGEFLARGSMLAAEQAGNKVLGRPIELIWLDESNTQGATQNFRRLVEENKVVAVVGGNFSSSALSMMKEAERAKIPLILPGAAATEITGSQCNRYTFRTQATVQVQIAALMPYLSKIGKKVYFITPSYAFGQDVVRVARNSLKPAGMTEIGSDEVPQGNSDFSSYILKMRKAQPDVVFGGLIGGDFSNFLKQWNELGMKEKIPYVAVAITDTDFWDVGPGASAGIYVKPWYYKNPSNTAQDKKMVEDFIKKYNRPPSDKTFSGWIAMRSLLDSINAAQSTDSKAIVQALEKWRDKEGDIPGYFRAWDHQLVRPAVIVGVKKKITDKWDFFDLLQNTTTTQADTDRDFGAQADSECKMGPL